MNIYQKYDLQTKGGELSEWDDQLCSLRRNRPPSSHHGDHYFHQKCIHHTKMVDEWWMNAISCENFHHNPSTMIFLLRSGTRVQWWWGAGLCKTQLDCQLHLKIVFSYLKIYHCAVWHNFSKCTNAVVRTNWICEFQEISHWETLEFEKYLNLKQN